ncbi:hypothetical protein ACS0TY_001517 [Phlomoides rotata]
MKIIITSTRNLPSTPPLIPRTCFPERAIVAFPISRASVAVKCSENGSSGSGDEGSLKKVLSGMVDERVEQLLKKQENRELLEGLEQASMRVEIAKRELALIEKQEIEARSMRDYIDQLESRASEIAECQKDILEAREMVKEAEKSLKGRDSYNQGSNKEEERFESVKAASISAVVGTLAQLPICLSRVTSNSELILPLTITFISCALFGVTFRYAVRRDLDNFQLKSGTSAAFGFVKGLGMLGAGPALEVDTSSFLSHAFDGAIYVSESLLIFLLAGVALDFCIKLRILSPFPIEDSVPRT